MKKIIPIIATVVLIGGGAFYGGMQYAQGRGTAANAGRSSGGFANASPEERQARLQQFGMGGQRNGRGAAGGFASGDILSKDAKGVTIKLRDGGSKLVFFTASTSVMKIVSGSVQDLAAGEQVSVTGSANQDGSINAQSFQIRPAGNN